MASIFDPSDPIAPFERPEAEYQVNVDPASDLGDLAAEIEPEEKEERSFNWAIFIILAVFTVLGFRLVRLQVAEGAVFQGLAQGNSIETRILPPPRGVITDRKGTILAKNIPEYDLELLPGELPKTHDNRLTVYRQIELVTGIKQQEIVDQVDKHGLRSLDPISLKSNIDRDTAMSWQVKLGDLSGVTISQEPVRSYDITTGLSHIIGYVGKATEKELKERPELSISSLVGKSGLESVYDTYLQGKPGKEELEVDSKGQIQRTVAGEPALPGKTLELNMDRELQQVMADALAEGAQTAGRKKAVAIAMDPRTGGVLAMVSLPSYDNNIFIQPDKKTERQAYFSDPDQPLFNRAVSGLYPPGSTSKPIWATAGLEEKVINESTTLQTPAQITVGKSVFPDWKPHGSADVKKAIAESNNIFFYALGGGWDKIKGLGITRMKEWANKFGWGKRTNIDLPGESKGLVPDPAWKEKVKKEPWTIGNTYHMSIGQGDLLLSPIQLITAISAIANGGTLYQPQVVKSIKDLDDHIVEDRQPIVVEKQIASPDVIRIVREGMRQTVTAGSARPLNDLPIQIAGKTGTAQFEELEKTHAWFVGFAPYDKPKITVMVMVEGGGESFVVAVPIAKKILSWYSEHDITSYPDR